MPQEYTDDLLLNALLKRTRRSRRIRLSDEERQALVGQISSDFQDCASANISFRNDRVVFLNNWRGTPEPIEDGPVGEKSANVRVPLTTTIIEQWKARLSKALLGGERIASFQSLDESLQDRMQELTDWFQWELENVVRLEDALDDILHHTLVDGICLPIPEYVRERRHTVRVVELDYLPGVELEEQLGSAIEFLFSGEEIAQVEPGKQPGIYEIRLSATPDETATITFLLDGYTLVAEVDRMETVFDGVRILVPNVEDVIIPNTHADVQQIPFFGLRSWLTVQEIQDRARAGGDFEYLSEEDLESIVRSAYASKTSLHLAMPLSEEHDLIEGTDSKGYNLTSPEDARRWVEVYRWEGEYTTAAHGRIKMAVWMAASSQIILRKVRLEDLNKDGERSPVKFEFIRDPGRFYGVGLAELLQHVQTEMNGIHNYRLNSGLIASAPTGFYEPAPGQARQVLSVEPGKWYPAKNVDKMKPMEHRWSPVWGFNEEALVKRYANELSGIGDMGSGSFVSKRVSAVEFMGTEAGTGARTEQIVRRFVRSLETLLYRIFGLYQQHASGARLYQVVDNVGMATVKRLSRDRLHGRMVLRLMGSVQHLSPQAEQEKNMNMLSLLLNPFLVQMGITKPDTVYSAVAKLARTMEYNGVKLHEPDSLPDSPKPDDEHRAMMRGEVVEPHMGENKALHIQEHGALLAAPNASLLMPDPRVRAALQEHLQKTVLMKQQEDMMRQALAQQAQEMQMGMEQMGVRPGKAGGQRPGQQAQPAEAMEMLGGMEGGMNGPQ